MQASATDIFKKLDVEELNTPMPRTSRLEGRYPGEGIIDYVLGSMIHIYYRQEVMDELETLDSVISSDKGEKWVNVKKLFSVIGKDSRENLEYGISKAYEFGYVNVILFNGVRYFNLTDKCKNVKLYEV